MKIKLIFLLIITTSAIYCFCDRSLRKPENSNDVNILIGFWKLIKHSHDRTGMSLMDSTYYLKLNGDLTYSMASNWPDYDSKQFHNMDEGRFYTNDDTLFLASSDTDYKNKTFIYKFNFKNQSMDLSVVDENQKSAMAYLSKELDKINRFGKRIDLNGDY